MRNGFKKITKFLLNLGNQGHSLVQQGIAKRKLFSLHSTTSKFTITAKRSIILTSAVIMMAVSGVAVLSVINHPRANAVAPIITSITPSRGPADGGTKITISGSNFAAVTKTFTQIDGNVGLLDDGTVAAWGQNDNGQLGNGSTDYGIVSHAYPEYVRGLDCAPGSRLGGAKQVAAAAPGSNTNYALLNDGTVVAWGNGNAGALGNGGTNNSPCPVFVRDTTGADGTKLSNVVQVVANGPTAYALLDDGTVVAWGRGLYGILGNGGTANSNYPVFVRDTTNAANSKLSNVKQISATQNNGGALLNDGTVVMWGYGNYGTLGNGGTVDSSYPVFVRDTTNAVNSKLSNVKQLQGGNLYSMAVLNDGTVVAWGPGTQGELGNGALTLRQTSPVFVLDTTGVAGTQLSGAMQLAVAKGSSTSYALLGDGTVVAWGAGDRGQRGDGSTVTNQLFPVFMLDTTNNPGSKLSDVQKIYSGQTGLFAFRDTGTPLTVGFGAQGQRGDASTSDIQSFPVYMTMAWPSVLGSETPTVTVGGQVCTNVVIVDSNTITCTTPAHPVGTVDVVVTDGYGQSATLANGFEYVPPSISSITPSFGPTGGGTNVTIAGEWFAEKNLAIKQIAASTYHTCAIASDDRVYCWGNNGVGQLGRTGLSSAIPTPVDTSGALNGKTIVQLTTGVYHTCVLDSAGQAYCWGNNQYGELARGTTGGSSSSPALITMSGALSGKTVKQIASGQNSYTTCAIASDNFAYCWGRNNVGQLGQGNGSNVDSNVPVMVNTYTPELQNKTVKTISLGANTVCIVASDDFAYCWGQNNAGQFGNGSASTQSDSPQPAAQGAGSALAGKSIKQIIPSANDACALTVGSPGQVYCWGSGGPILGNGTNTVSRVPLAVSTADVLKEKDVVSIGVGYDFACASTRDGVTACWGYNLYGQTGIGVTGGQSGVPVAISKAGNLTDKGTGSLGVGYAHACTIADDGRAYCWGYNNYGQLGTGNQTNTGTPTPTKNDNMKTPLSVTIGGNACSNIVLVNGSTITCKTAAHAPGKVDVVVTNGDGQTATLTNGYEYTVPTITSIAPNEGPIAGGTNVTITGTNFFYKEGVEVAQVVNGDGFSLALDTDGDVWAWGNNQYGQLGNTTNSGNTSPNSTPTKITVGAKFTQVVAGGQHSMAIDTDGNVWAWGQNNYGQLGYNANDAANSTPIKITSGVKFTQISGGYYHSLALDESGDIWAWGNNQYGQLGFTANNTANPTPTKVTVSAKFDQITAGYYFSSALDTDGDIWAWGYNYSGQLGFSANNTANPTPTKVAASVKFSQISDGDHHSLALDENGDIWAWGDNRYGELGNKTNSGNYNPNPTPTQVASDVKFSQIVGGYYYSFALDTNGDIWAWGDNRYGQLGTTIGSGAYTANPTPTKVAATVKFKQINADGAKGASSFAIDINDDIWAWGWNYYGQLGNTTNNSTATPNPTPTMIDRFLPPPTILSPITSVTLGGAACTDLTLVSPTTLTCTTSAHTPGLVDVVATNSDGQTATLPNAFTYIPPPTITSISPNTGETTGGTTVTITGTGLTYVDEVLLDTAACTNLTIISDTQATCLTPAHATGTVNVTVSNVLDQTATLTDAFTYHPPYYIDLTLSKTDIKLYPGIDEVADTDYTIATTDTNWPQGYILSIEQGPDGSALKCNTNPSLTLPTTTADNTATLDINSWGAGTGTVTNPPTNWRTISSTPTTLGTSATPGTFNDYIYFGARVNYAQKPCTYEGAVIVTAVMGV